MPADVDRSGTLDPGHREDLHRRPLTAQPTNGLQAPLAGHEDVHDHHVGGVSLEGADPCVAVRGLPDLVAGELQMLRQSLPERDVVVDDQDSGHASPVFVRCTM